MPKSISSGQRVVQSEEVYFGLLHHGLRLGVEYLAVDITSGDEHLQRLLSAKGWTKVIGHYFDCNPSTAGWHDESRLAKYDRAVQFGCDIIRLVQVASTRKDNDDVRQFVDKVATLPGLHPPLIAYNLGPLGRTSLVFNQTLTPVIHPALKPSSNGCPESLITAQQATQALYQSFVLDPLHFCIVGASVFYSLSPAMHNAAYRVCGMNHNYEIHEAASLEELQDVFRDSNFGGASVSHPFKVGMVSQLSAKSYHAQAIGAVNTLLPLRALPDGSVPALEHQASQRNRSGPVAAWYGDNTDWIGIKTCLRRNLSPRNAIQTSKSTGLVIGAGGMARAAIYAMLQLGCRKVFIFNRTVANAEKVATHFNSLATISSEHSPLVSVLRSRNDPWPAGFLPATMMVSCVPAHSIGERPAADFEMPLQWLGSPSGGVIIEVSTLQNFPLHKFTPHSCTLLCSRCLPC
jgi:shikimate 5-dehydrogenase